VAGATLCGAGLMATARPKILVLSGRLGRTRHPRPLLPWLDRLESRGLAIQLLCGSGAGSNRDDSRVMVVRSLSSRWLRGWATHWLPSDPRLDRPALIHVLDESLSDVAIGLAESMRVSYIQSVSGFRTIEQGLKISRRWCRCVAVTNRELASDLISELGVPPELIAVVPPGIVCPHVPERGQKWTGVPVIGAGGTIDRSSGFSVFLEAARLILESGRDAEFILSASGDEPAVLRRLAQDLRIGERLTLVDDSFDWAEFWSVLDLYCQPSLSATTGSSLLSAGAHAIPLIATRVKGPREMIEPGVNGLLIPPDDARAMARAVAQLLDDASMARGLGHAAREFVRAHHDPEVEAELLAGLYRTVLAGGYAAV
jgi:glycosyltransferase involved in cell wall biosynthesis